jgi:poly-gamma-glutamate synthesis protein (capsule biosynthesis protein)
LEEIVSADLSVVNLECPLITKETPIEKVGRILSASSRTIHGFKAANWHVLNLANNHSFDHGAIGLRETIDTIKGAGLSFVGVGSNIKEAQTPFVIEIHSQRVVIYSMAEHEFSIADEKTPGANPLDIINFVNAIRQHKQQGIFIVLMHGGNEFYQYPSPEMVRRCRFMVDRGRCCCTPMPTHGNLLTGQYGYGLGN